MINSARSVSTGSIPDELRASFKPISSLVMDFTLTTSVASCVRAMPLVRQSGRGRVLEPGNNRRRHPCLHLTPAPEQPEPLRDGWSLDEIYFVGAPRLYASSKSYPTRRTSRRH